MTAFPGRRGVVYLISALLIVAILLAIMYARTLPTGEERSRSVVTRIQAMSDFLSDFHGDVPRATYIAGFRSLIAIEQYTSQEGVYVTNATPLFIEAFMNGTVDGQPYDILTNSTFGDYLGRVNDEARQQGIALNVTVQDIALNQSTPWSIDVSFLMTVNVTDTRGLARWDYQKWFTTEVSILDLRDPAYSVSTDGKLPNTIRESPYNNSDLVTGNNTANLDDEIQQGYYREDPYAPSYLQRLQGDLNGTSKYGIASIINLDDLNAQGLPVYTDRSTVDAYYFSGRNATLYCPTEGSPLPSWFKLDATHYDDPAHDYGLSKLNATIC